jgi:hypothetical protein
MLRLSLFLTVLFPVAASAQPPPSYSKQIKPFFDNYCVSCHNAKESSGDLNLESYKSLMAGGESGAAIVAGKPDMSRLVRQIEGKAKPVMPPPKEKQPKKEEIALVRAWVLAGARDDGTAAKVTLPKIAPKKKTAPPITALAYSPAGKWLAAAGSGEVLLVDTATGETKGTWNGHRSKITAVTSATTKDWLAVASGEAGGVHHVRLGSIGDKVEGWPVSLHQETPAPKHDDVIQDVAFSKDGKLLATASYDRLVKLYDVKEQKELKTLKDHSDSVYGVCFSPDGKLLASVAADRAVKVWDVAAGNRLYTLGESTDWLYCVAWHPDGKHLAAAGVDKSIRVWKVDAKEGKVVHSVFAHEGPVLRLIYSEDGKTLYSLGEDRVVKSWDADKMTERKVYDKQPESVLSLAVRPDQKQLALGRYDGALVLIDAETGKVQSQPLPVKPKPPVLDKVAPVEMTRGKTTEIKLTGKNLRGSQVVTTIPGATVTAGATSDESLTVTVSIGATTAPGEYQMRVKNDGGESVAKPIIIDRFTSSPEAEPNNSPRTGQKVSLPLTIVGEIGRAGDLDWFRFEAKAGQEVGVQALTAALGSKLDPVLQLVDPDGEVVAETTNGLLGHVCKRAGTYSLGIRDREYRGGAGMNYRLHVGDIPVITNVFPLGVQKGASVPVRLEGVHLGKVRTVNVKAPATAAVGSRLPVPLPTNGDAVLGSPSLVVGEFAETVHTDKDTTLTVPGTGNGVIARGDQTQTWKFAAKKGQRLILEINARRIGSPLDSTIEILDDTGKPLPRAVLRSLARTYSVFRDHDSSSPGIRIEAWSELAVDDYLLVGSELLRIRALPRNPDDDCQFWSEQGKRLGYLGTTPTHVSQSTAMYKVSMHPPGTKFPANGLPVVTLFWRNDDGGPRFDKDSRLVFDPPADGTYQVRVGDARGHSGADHAYQLTIRQPRPDFRVSLSPASPAVSKGGATPVRVNVTRLDEFDGVIDIKLLNLPPGFEAPATNIPSTDDSTAFALFASEKSNIPAKQAPLQIEARAKIEGKEVVRTATGGVPKLVESGDIATSTEQSEVTLKPGGEVKVTVNIQRRDPKVGRIPLDVQGLPHGVRVLDVGLNGILITEMEKTRTFVLYAEPWVKPMNHPIVVLARREDKNTEYAAKSLLLRVSK